MKTNIVFTGGGTAGHVTPNLALIEGIRSEGGQVAYIGSKASVEQEIIGKLDIPFYAISSGKLRRYFSWKNFLAPFSILCGIAQAYFLLSKLKTKLVFSKGGFVAFPVVVAAWLHRIPVVAHESDMTPGLANRLSFPFVNKICLNFEMAKDSFKKQSLVEVTGTPIRSALFKGERAAGLHRCGFSAEKPCILVMGGSQGAQRLNEVIRAALPELLKEYQLIHLCGRGKTDPTCQQPGYCQFDYVDIELPDLYAASDLIISRSGANSLCEILALQKPHILIPLPARVSRGDQIQNAEFFKKQEISTVIQEDNLSVPTLVTAVQQVFAKKESIIQKIKFLDIQSATEKILAIIKQEVRV